jgi:hypothetical protein
VKLAGTSCGDHTVHAEEADSFRKCHSQSLGESHHAHTSNDKGARQEEVEA